MKNTIFRAKRHIYLFPTQASKTIPPSRDIKNHQLQFFQTSRHNDSIPKWDGKKIFYILNFD